MLIGASGQVGSELAPRLAGLGEVRAPSHTQLDLGSEPSLRAAVRDFEPTLIVNAAAYTAVDRAESEREMARRVNATAPAILAEEARRCRAVLVHYSTDYVFDGEKSSPYQEDDATGPLNEYGRSKLEGEQRIAAAGEAYFILRTGWVYRSRGANFMLTMLRRGGEQEEIRVVNDQIGTPTPAAVVAEATLAVLNHCRRHASGLYECARSLAGIYHTGCAGQTSWFEFARSIFAEARKTEAGTRLKVKQTIPIASAEYPSAARRPRYSVLSKEKIRRVFGVEAAAWESGLRGAVREWAQASAGEERAR